jgi:hypothetical protein
VGDAALCLDLSAPDASAQRGFRPAADPDHCPLERPADVAPVIYIGIVLFLTSCQDWEAGVEFHYSYSIKAKIGSAPPPPTAVGVKKKLPKVKFAFGVKIQQP